MESKPVHILLADDDKEDWEFFQEALAAIPIHTQLTTVNNGKRLMEWLIEHPSNLPDLLFLDLEMPLKNGQQCLSEIKSTPYLVALPVIIFSLIALPALLESLYAKGALYYIKKPNSIEGLTQTIEQLLLLPEEKKWVQPSFQDFMLYSVN